MALAVAFTDMWSKFDPYNNFFVRVLQHMNIDLVVTEPEACTVLFFGPFGNRHLKYTKAFRIHFTGENTRPLLDMAHACITFDFDSFYDGNYNARNYRLPLWYLHIDWFDNKKNGDNDHSWLVPVSYLNGSNEFTETPKTRFCGTVFANKSLYRLEALREFALKYKHIDAYGGDNLLPIIPGEYSKCKTLAQYKFVLCFENSSYPGYVTEKLFHAKLLGGVPIYWGNRTAAMDFNPEGYLFFDGNFDSLIRSVRDLDENPDAYAKIAAAPMFTTPPSLTTITDIFAKIFKL